MGGLEANSGASCEWMGWLAGLEQGNHVQVACHLKSSSSGIGQRKWVAREL